MTLQREADSDEPSAAPDGVAPSVLVCQQCAAQLPPAMLVCPRCGRLVHAESLERLAQAAREATQRGDATAALVHWREALERLPVGSKQHEAVSAKITELGKQLPSGAVPPPPDGKARSGAMQAAAGLGAIGLLFWKLKTLLLGLTKGTTFFSMFLSLGVYWTAWGWKFALGLVLSIYVHEMGHVIALRRYGFRATAPMFVPGLGALIRLQQQVVNPQEDADIGLAGPIYGLAAALVVLVCWSFTGLPILAAIAGFGAWLNLFNLLPLGFLDGGRAFHAMSRTQKLLAGVTTGVAWYLTGDGLLPLIALVCLYRAWTDKPSSGSWKTSVTFYSLVAALSAVMLVRTYAGVEL